MKKLVRILGLIQQIRNKKIYSARMKRQLIRTLLYLEYKSYMNPASNVLSATRILHYTVYSYGHANLCILFREIFIEEEYQYFITKDTAPAIIDCGANIGLATLYLKWKFPEAVIHAFEPDPSAFELLEKNIQANALTKVSLYNQAAMDKSGSLEFYRSQQNKASLMMSTLKGRMYEESITVEAIDFPLFIQQSDATLLKIDIEGAETGIFERMHAQTGFGNLKQIIMEYHHKIEGHPSELSRMLSLLEQHHFEYNLITRFEEPGQFQDILIYAWRN
jgi:FkbM family methyltransferase